MFKNSRTKRVLTMIVIMTMVLTTVAVAANNVYTKQLTATYGRIKFKIDGKDITSDLETKYGAPAFIAGDKSYVPVRAIAELTGMEIKWDGTTYTAELIDTKAKAYKESLEKKDAAILKLNDQVNALNAEIKKLKSTVVDADDLKTLEKQLNKDFAEDSGVYFSIALKESKEKITITINIDTKDTSQRNAWRKMKASDKQYIIKDIVSRVAKDFGKFKIEGTLYDNYAKRTLYSFSINNNGNTVVTNKDTGYDYDDRYGYGDIEYYAEDTLKYYFGRIAYVDRVSVAERNNGTLYGTLEISNNGSRPNDTEIRDAFRDAERDLIREYGSSAYLDIQLYLNGSSYGYYYDGVFR